MRAGKHCNFCLALIDQELAGAFFDFTHRLECDRKTLSYIIVAHPGKASGKELSGLLERGFDDFVYTDINHRVLAAKLGAHLRRALPGITALQNETCSSSGKLLLNRESQTVLFTPEKQHPVEISGLTGTEFEILAVLLNQEGKVVPRCDLRAYIWGDRTVNLENVDKHVESIRRKLRTTGVRIKAVYGTGYMLCG